MKRLRLRISYAVAILAFAAAAGAQTCQTHDEIGGDVRAGIEKRAQQIFEQAVRGDVAALQASAIPSLQQGFEGVSAAVNDNKAALSSAHNQVRATFLLDTGATP